tara:strand:+ start:58 stop:489 length:432 start_codon:yes stop_codon:yes gene_type:complete
MTEVIKIPNISKFSQIIIKDELYLFPLDYKFTMNEILEFNVNSSKILQCKINNKIVKNNYRPILINVYKNCLSSKIIKNTTFNIDLNINVNNGYTWEKDLKFSFQNKDATGTLKEIVKMCNINNIKIEILIELKNKDLILYKQ